MLRRLLTVAVFALTEGDADHARRGVGLLCPTAGYAATFWGDPSQPTKHRFASERTWQQVEGELQTLAFSEDTATFRLLVPKAMQPVSVARLSDLSLEVSSDDNIRRLLDHHLRVLGKEL